MAVVQHPSGHPTWRVDDPTPYTSVGWSDITSQSTQLDKMTIAQLRDFAAERDIDLGDVTKKADIIAIIREA